MNVNAEEYIALLKISGLTKAMIRVYRPILINDGLCHLFDALDKEIKNWEALHGMGESRTEAVE